MCADDDDDDDKKKGEVLRNEPRLRWLDLVFGFYGRGPKTGLLYALCPLRVLPAFVREKELFPNGQCSSSGAYIPFSDLFALIAHDDRL